MTRLSLDGLSARGLDGRTTVLHDVTLDVADGETVALVGSGKTTLLQAVMGLVDVPAGALLLDGEIATDWAPAERDLAMVFQDHAPYPHLRVRDPLALPLRVARVPGGGVARRGAQVAETLGLSVHLDRWPSQLSGGQRQRVAVGRVLIRPQPGAYLLDEPLSADPAMRARLRGLLGGRTALWATPDVAEAAAVGDRVAVLRDGRLVQVGTPQQLAERPTSLDVAAMAPLNVRRGTIADGSLRLPIGTLPLDRPAGDVLVGIRPGDLTERGDGVRIPLLGGDGAAPDGTATLRHPALARAAEEDPSLSAVLLARVEPGGRRSVPVLLDPARVLLFDPETGEAL